MNAQLSEVLGAISTQQNLIADRFAEYDKRMSAIETMTKSRKVSLPGVELEKKEFSFTRAVNAIVEKDWSGAGFEKEVFDNTRKKAGSTADGTGGGFIVPVEYISDLIERLMAQSIIYQIGATVFNDLVGSPLEIPRQTGGATGYWVGENTPIPDSDVAFSLLTLTPKSAAALVKVSNRLLKLSNPSAEDVIRRDIVRVLSLQLDHAALMESGIGSEPLGIINMPGVNTIALGTNGGQFTFDKAADMATTLEEANALKGKLAYIWNPAVKGSFIKQKVLHYSNDTTGAPLILPMSDENLRNLLGYDFKTTTIIPANLSKGNASNLSPVFFGNWEELIIAQWGGMELFASSETSDAFEKNQTWIRVIQEVNFGLRHEKSFCVVMDADTINS